MMHSTSLNIQATPAPKLLPSEYVKLIKKAVAKVVIKTNSVEEMVRSIDRLWDRKEKCDKLLSYFAYIEQNRKEYLYLEEGEGFEGFIDMWVKSIPDLVGHRKFICDKIGRLLEFLDKIKEGKYIKDKQ